MNIFWYRRICLIQSHDTNEPKKTAQQDLVHVLSKNTKGPGSHRQKRICANFEIPKHEDIQKYYLLKKKIEFLKKHKFPGKPQTKNKQCRRKKGNEFTKNKCGDTGKVKI